MKRLLGVLLLLAACKHPNTATALTGAETPKAAVQAFLAAARAEDLQAMSAVWGTEKGPARDQMDAAQFEKRELILICHFKSDTDRILSEGPSERGERMLRVQLTKRGVTRETKFFAVLGPSKRWYVVNANLDQVKDFCRDS